MFELDRSILYKKRLLDLAKKQGIVSLSDAHVAVRGPELARRLLRELVYEKKLENSPSGGFSIPKEKNIQRGEIKW